MVSVYPIRKADHHTGQPRRGQNLLCHASCGGLHQSKAFARYGDPWAVQHHLSDRRGRSGWYRQAETDRSGRRPWTSACHWWQGHTADPCRWTHSKSNPGEQCQAGYHRPGTGVFRSRCGYEQSKWSPSHLPQSGRYCTGYRVCYRSDRTPQQSRRNAKHLPGIRLYRHYGGSPQSAVYRQTERQSHNEGAYPWEKLSCTTRTVPCFFSGRRERVWMDRCLWHYRRWTACRNGHSQDGKQDRTGRNADTGTAGKRKENAKCRAGKSGQWPRDFLTHHANGEKPYRRQAHNRERRHSMGLLSPKLTQEQGKRGKDGKVFIDTLMLPPCLVPSYWHRPMMNSHRAFFIYRRILNEQYRNQHRHLPDCQKADRQDNLYRACAFQPDRQGDDGGQNQAYASWGSPQNVTSLWIWWKSPWLFVSGETNLNLKSSTLNIYSFNSCNELFNIE